MSLKKQTLTNVNDETRWNASEALAGTIAFALDGQTGTGTYVFEARIRPQVDASQAVPAWTSVQVVNLTTGTFVTSSTGPGLFRFDCSGQLEFRVRSTTATGTIDVFPGVTIG